MNKEVVNQELLNEWYETHLVGEGIIAIGEPFHEEEVFSYLVIGKDADLLVDTGMGIKPISGTIDKIRNKNKPIMVINTHGHFDHIGGNRHFNEVLIPNHPWEITTILNGYENISLENYGVLTGFWKGMPEMFDSSRLTIPPFYRIKPLLEEGYKFDLGDRKLSVIETPGHTPSGISLFDEKTGHLFTSDLLYQGPLYSFLTESSPKDYYLSLQKIKRMGDSITSIHPGHNYPNAQMSLIDFALECFDMFLENKPASEQKNIDGEDVLIFKHPFVQRLSLITKKL